MTYWCDEQLVVHIVGPDGEREVVVDRPYAQIGAHSQSQVVLSGPGVAKRSLLLLATDPGIYLLNLDLEDASLEERGRWITENEPLLVGNYRLTVRTAKRQSARPPTPDLIAVKSATPIPVVHVYCGRLLKDRRRFRHPLSIVGRRPQCSLQLRGLQVSSFHCAMYWHDQRLWCIDLLSSNGTRLNGEPFVCGELRLHDRLEVGEFGLLYYRWSPRRTTPGLTPEQAADGPRRRAVSSPKSPEPAIDASAGDPSPLPAPAPPALPFHAESHEPPDALVLDIAAFHQESTGEQERLRQTLAAEQARLAADRLALQQHAHEATEQRERRIRELETDAARLDAERLALAATLHDFQQEYDAMTQQLADRDSQLSNLQHDLAAARAELAARASEPAQFAAERLAVEQQSTAAAEQLERRLREVAEDAARLAAERRALEATRQEWRQERDALMHQLASRAAQLSRLEAELAAATNLRGTRVGGHAAAAAPAQSERPGPAPHLDRWLTEPTPPPAFALSASDTQIEFAPPVLRGSQDPAADPVLRGSQDPAAGVLRASPDVSVLRASPDGVLRASPDGVLRGSHDPAAPETSAAALARRKTQARGELTSFVSGRLGDIERSRLRHIFLLWTAIALGSLTLGLLAFGIWSWLL